ncbi:methenyltetrahydromethanopterin cyclohydrolase [Adhaeretor mobilis]|nr:methenyltetrahydromethanopterin cyclohydrolase [Adhaeretor mobilis]
MNLNHRAALLCDDMLARADELGIRSQQLDCGTTLIDCGIQAAGGLAAGVMLARACTAELAEVTIVPSGSLPRPTVQVTTDHPKLACMASQYAGWEVKGKGFFAMGSGPMRAAAAREPLFEDLKYKEQAKRAVGVLETAQFPGEEVCGELADKCGVTPDNLILLLAPTKSLAGGVQVVARSVETALHKLHELKFDLDSICSGWGCAPLSPPAKDDVSSVGRTNDAILYGGHVVLHVRCKDAAVTSIGEQIPSSASSDYGRPFGEVLASYEYDFYKVDPLLFSPAMVTLVNLKSGNTFRYGELNQAVLAQSFGESL